MHTAQYAHQQGKQLAVAVAPPEEAHLDANSGNEALRSATGDSKLPVPGFLLASTSQVSELLGLVDT
jgi:hypothetical protein